MIARTLLHLCALERNLRRDLSSLKRQQNRRLRVIVKHAYDTIPFYHRKFRSAGISPADIKTVEDLDRVPFATKLEIQRTPFEDLISRSSEGKRCIERETSGSTGIPLKVAIDPSAVDVENAFWIRAYFKNGMKPWHKTARIADPRNFPPAPGLHEKLGMMRTKFISVFDDPRAQSSIIDSWKPDVIRGYTTCVESLASFCIENGVNVGPCLVFTSAELLDQKARAIINSAFNTELFDLYVSVEFGLMAWECVEHSGYHINSDGLVLEFVQDGDVTECGEKGEIVCTGLFNTAMPLIRYRLGDVAVMSEEECGCGITLPLMKIVEGRSGDYLRAMDGRRIPPIVFFPYPFDDVGGIKQFRIIQERRDRLLVELVVNSDRNRLHSTLEKAERNLKDLFGEGMNVDFAFVENIKREPRGKLKKIISHLGPGYI